MSLELGKSFNRQYVIRIPLQNNYYDVGIFLNNKSVFSLFDVKSNTKTNTSNFTISMFKNIQGSKFCETFLELHSYRKNFLDILNQFERIKDSSVQDVSFLFNENIRLSIVNIGDRELSDVLSINAFTINSLSDEFIFLLVERQHISKQLQKKIVRTTGCQIASPYALDVLNQHHQDYLEDLKNRINVDPNDTNHDVITVKLT